MSSETLYVVVVSAVVLLAGIGVATGLTWIHVRQHTRRVQHQLNFMQDGIGGANDKLLTLTFDRDLTAGDHVKRDAESLAKAQKALAGEDRPWHQADQQAADRQRDAEEARMVDKLTEQKAADIERDAMEKLDASM